MPITHSSDVMGGYPTSFAAAPGYVAENGLGGIGLFGLIGVNSLLGNGLGNCAYPNGLNTTANIVADQNISELRKDVQGVNTTVHELGNEVQAALAQQTLSQNVEFRNLDNRLCNSEKSMMDGFFNVQTAGLQNTIAIKDQLTQNTIGLKDQITAGTIALKDQITSQTSLLQGAICDIKSAINADGDATRALINSIEMQTLRDQLELERRGRQFREVEINVTQTNQQTQNQLQSQLQAQSQAIGNALNMLGDQINRQTNSMINLGTMTGNAQTATNANTRVNS